jgi:transcription-repair coupling factor (superfamily II helicase)
MSDLIGKRFNKSMTFHESAKIDTDKLLAYVSKNQKTIKIRPDNKLVFTKDEAEDFEGNKEELTKILLEITSLDT